MGCAWKGNDETFCNLSLKWLVLSIVLLYMHMYVYIFVWCVNIYIFIVKESAAKMKCTDNETWRWEEVERVTWV